MNTMMNILAFKSLGSVQFYHFILFYQLYYFKQLSAIILSAANPHKATKINHL